MSRAVNRAVSRAWTGINSLARLRPARFEPGFLPYAPKALTTALNDYICYTIVTIIFNLYLTNPYPPVPTRTRATPVPGPSYPSTRSTRGVETGKGRTLKKKPPIPLPFLPVPGVTRARAYPPPVPGLPLPARSGPPSIHYMKQQIASKFITNTH